MSNASETPAAVVPRRFRAVAFDMDGLMFNTEDVYTLVGDELMGRRGLVFGKELKDAMMGLQPRAAFEVMIRWHALNDTPEGLIEECNAAFLGLFAAHIECMPGLLDLLDALEAAGIPKGIGTSSGRVLVEACLNHFDLMRRFQFSLTAEDIHRGKPDPEIYLTAAARFGVAPAEMVVLEDSQNGCRAAAAAGAFAVAVPGAHSLEHDFTGASLVVESLADRRLYAALGIGGGPDKMIGR